MPTNASGHHDKSGSPLFKVFFIVACLLLLPAVIYSISPQGPIQVGDTVFSNGKHHVRFSPHPAQPNQQGETCVLELGTPLIVMERPSPPPTGTFSARVQGTTTLEAPFCPPQATIRITRIQINQGRNLWREWRQKFSLFWD